MGQFNVKDIRKQIIVTNNTFLCWAVSGSAETNTATKVESSQTQRAERPLQKTTTQLSLIILKRIIFIYRLSTINKQHYNL